MSIRGVFVDGDWKTDPDVVKDAFKDHFAARFKQPANGWLKLNIPFTNRLSTEQAADMDRCVSRDEIHIAVWNCGENKSPGPDGWIRGTLSSAMASILVNGSPTSEFREWSDSNMNNIVKILKCLFLASGLKINIQKSQVLGVGVPRTLVTQVASLIGCALMQKPFRYLGVMVGDCMSRKLAWAETVQKLHSRLSNWKVKTLFIEGRLTLLKSVLGAYPLYNMSIYKAPKGVLNEMEVIRSKFSKETDKDSAVASKLGSPSLEVSFRRSVLDGVERQQLFDLNSLTGSLILSSSKDRWICDLNGDGEFRVKDLDRLSTRSNLIRRGVVLESPLCPMCGPIPEDIHHVIFRCDIAQFIFRRICRWWDLDWHDLFSFSDWHAWFSAIRLTSRLKLILEGVFYIAWWHLWAYRNQTIFAETSPRRSVIFMI
ncbi:RNA-directed DNA polymerase, eukaryota [Tanacetum coccineum]